MLSLCALSVWLQTDSARQMIFQRGIGMLQEKLQTKVTADSLSIELFKGQVRLYNMQVNDRSDSLLLHIGELHAGIAPHALFVHKVLITDVELKDADARLWKDSLTSNFQFIIDAFKKKDKADKQIKKPRKEPKMAFEVEVENINLQNIHLKWDVRHKARKNLNRPNRGAFDANHVDAILSMKASVSQSRKDSYDVSIYNLNARDRSSGLVVNQLNLQAEVSKEKIDVARVLVTMAHSKVTLGRFTIDLKTKSIPTPFVLKANVLLQDISQPFGPALSHFTTPLELRTEVGGPLACLNLENIRIQTPDKRLYLTAKGKLDGLFARKEKLNLQFYDIDMKASHNIKEQIVMHFAKKVRLKMIRQMKAVGDITFQGSVGVKYKKEFIEGHLTTRYGDLDTKFLINDSTHFMTGFLNTSSMEIGKLMNIADLGPVNCHIDFNINISKKAKRPATALPNGRLPMGTISAKVYNASYSTIKASSVTIFLESDGSTASGYLKLPGKLNNISAHIRYIQTDTKQNLWFNLTPAAQQWLFKESLSLLKEKLHVDVDADSLYVNFFRGTANLYRLRIKDNHHKPFLTLDTLHVSLNSQELFNHKLHINNIGLHGLQVHIKNDSVSNNLDFLTSLLKTHTPRRLSSSPLREKAPKDGEGHSNPFSLSIDLEELDVTNMHVTYNNFDLIMNMQAGIKQLANGAFYINLRKMNMKECNSGFYLSDLRTNATIHKDSLHFDHLYIEMPQTTISADPFTMRRKGSTYEFASPFMFYAHVTLQDLAHPFMPMFSHFTEPLDIQALVSGSFDNIIMKEMMIQTSDSKLNMVANALYNSKPFNIKLSNIELNSDNETLMRIVSLFAKHIRLKMLRQMGSLGDVHFYGDIDIIPKRENFTGTLSTEFGTVQTKFVINDSTHFMTGYVDAPSLDIGKFLNIKPLKPINAHIDFNFNISKKTPRPATALPNGRLPQGDLKATIKNVKYGILRTKKLEASATSDGSTATGNITIPILFSDLIINFNYIQTDEIQSVKVKPKYKFRLPFKLPNLRKKQQQSK